MYTQTKQVIFENSPFLPNIDLKIVRKISKNITKGIHPTNVIAFYLGEINISNRALLEEEFTWISEAFQISSTDIDFYTFGFSAVPHLIYGSWSSRSIGVERAVEEICVSSPDPLVIRYNQYKADMLPTVYRFFEPFIQDPVITAAPIYSACRVTPFSQNFWFLVGLDASERLFREYAKLATTPLS